MPTDKQIQNPLGVAPLVKQAAQQQFALKNGGMLPPNTAPLGSSGNMVRGRFETIQTGEAPQTNFENMEKPQEFQPQNEKMEINQPIPQPYDAHTAEKTPQPQTNFEGMAPPPTGWNPDGSARHDALSEALSGYKHDFNQPQPEFKKDDSKRDGGFFSWLRGLAPKLRPGMRDGETEEDYDRRMTTNRERLLALGDAMRHIGNIVNTGKGAPSQQFNDPISQEEGRYQQRKAERQRKDALDAENARKAAEMGLKEKAYEADRQYKLFLMGMKNDAAGLNRDKFEYQKEKNDRDFEYRQGKDARDFEEKKRHNLVSEGQGAQRIGISQYNATHKGSGKSGKSGSGSSAKYWFEDKNGKMHYQPNKTMWEQEYYREYGKLPNEGTSTSTSTKTTDYKTGKETTTTTRTKGNSVTAQAAQAQNAAKAARQKPKPSPAKKPSGNKRYTNTRKLGL